MELEAPNNKQLFIIMVTKKGEEGWYFTTGVEIHKEGCEVMAWAGPGPHPWPTKVHVPYWAKKAAAWLLVEPLHHWSERRIVELGALHTAAAEAAAEGLAMKTELQEEEQQFPDAGGELEPEARHLGIVGFGKSGVSLQRYSLLLYTLARL